MRELRAEEESKCTEVHPRRDEVHVASERREREVATVVGGSGQRVHRVARVGEVCCVARRAVGVGHRMVVLLVHAHHLKRAAVLREVHVDAHLAACLLAHATHAGQCSCSGALGRAEQLTQQ